MTGAVQSRLAASTQYNVKVELLNILIYESIIVQHRERGIFNYFVAKLAFYRRSQLGGSSFVSSMV